MTCIERHNVNDRSLAQSPNIKSSVSSLIYLSFFIFFIQTHPSIEALECRPFHSQLSLHLLSRLLSWLHFTHGASSERSTIPIQKDNLRRERSERRVLTRAPGRGGWRNRLATLNSSFFSFVRSSTGSSFTSCLRTSEKSFSIFLSFSFISFMILRHDWNVPLSLFCLLAPCRNPGTNVRDI